MDSLPAINDPVEEVRCGYCGDIIGVYEPMVIMDADGTRETSQLAEQGHVERDAANFHRTCHANLHFGAVAKRLDG